MDTLTAKQEAACQAYIQCGGNQSAAYRMAYNAENMKPAVVWVKASELFNNGKVTVRIMELLERLRLRHMVNLDGVTMELDAARDLARENNQPSAMVAATMSKAKLHGLVTDKKFVELGARVEFDIDRVLTFRGVEPLTSSQAGAVDRDP